MKKFSTTLLLLSVAIVPFSGCGADSAPKAPEQFSSSPMADENVGTSGAAARQAAAKAKDKIGSAAEPID